MADIEGKIARWREWRVVPFPRKAFVVAVLVAAAGAIVSLQFGVVGSFVGVVLVVMALALVASAMESGPCVGSLMRKHIDRDRYSAKVTVEQKGTVTGRDKGVAWFEDGLLHFEGAGTAFAISGRPFEWEPADAVHFRPHETFTIRIADSGVPSTLILEAEVRCEVGSSSPTQSRFKEELEACRSAGAGAEEMLPPSGLQEEVAFTKRGRVWMTQTLCVALPWLAILLFIAPQPSGLGVMVLLVVGIWAGIRLAAFARERKYRRLFADDPIWKGETAPDGATAQ